MCTSHSSVLTPRSSAVPKACRVFSGASAAPPRCACTSNPARLTGSADQVLELPHECRRVVAGGDDLQVGDTGLAERGDPLLDPRLGADEVGPLQELERHG